MLIGITLGALAGYFGGPDRAIMVFINVVWSIPTLLLVIGITLVLGRGFWQVFIAVGLSMWVGCAFGSRQALAVKERTYISSPRTWILQLLIIFSHILPVITGPIIVIASANFASAILIESGLMRKAHSRQFPVGEGWSKNTSATCCWASLIWHSYPDLPL